MISLLGTAVSGAQGEGASISISHTLVAGSDRIVIVFVSQTYYNSGELITGVTYGGVAMTQIVGVGSYSTSYRRLSAWYLLNSSLPSDGAKTVQASFGASVLSSIISVVAIQGAKQQAYETSGTYRNDASSSAVSSISITTVAGNAWAFSCGSVQNNYTWTHGAGQTEITDIGYGGATPLSHGTSWEEIASPGSVTQTDTALAGDRMLGVAFSFAPAPISNFFPFF